MTISIADAVRASGGILFQWLTKRIDADVERKSDFYKHRVEQELVLYREIWLKLHAFYDGSFWRFTWRDEELGANERRQALQTAQREFSEIIWRNRPFYPSEIRRELQRFLDLCEKLIRIQEFIQVGKTSPADGERLEALQLEAKDQYSTVEEAIRRRLNQFGGD